MNILNRVAAVLSPPLEIEVRCAADFERVPEGFFQLQKGGEEFLGHKHTCFGVRFPVRETFCEGGVNFKLIQERESLPLVRLVPPQPPRVLEL